MWKGLCEQNIFHYSYVLKNYHLGLMQTSAAS